MDIINIMTSCNDAIAEYILPQLASIGLNLSKYQINFYLFYSDISLEKLAMIKEYSKSFKNICYKEIFIENIEPYKKLDELSHCNSAWSHETYFSLCCHKYLPDDVDRILYIDAGDVIIERDIGEYYFGDFEDNSIIATLAKLVEEEEVRCFDKYDLNNPELLKEVKDGIFNSGVYVINVIKFRESNRTLGDFIHIANTLRKNKLPEEENAYFGDQGLLSVAFIGDIKYFAYPEIKSELYFPYNFCIYYFNLQKDLRYTPKVLHYAGISFKPWIARFYAEEVEKYKFETDFDGTRAPFFLNGKQIEFFEIWWKYCEMTPIYEQVNKRASIYARALETHFLPLCKKYNDLL